MMKKQILLFVALFSAAVSFAQTDVDMGKLFTIADGEKAVDLNAPSTVKDGVVFVGDTREADKIEEGKYRGMRVTKARRHFSIGGKVRQYTMPLAFRRAPHGSTKEHKVDIALVPRSCMVQVKPISDGTFTFAAQTNKPEGNNIYVAVRNGSTFNNIATLGFKKDEAITGRKDAPYTSQTCNYKYADGDEVWIYSDGGVNLFGLLFSGEIDKSFTGSDPVQVAKDVRRAQK